MKSVLTSLPLYYFSLYKAPAGVIEALEKLMRHFLWSGSHGENKMHWVSWELVTTPKRLGGWGVMRLSEMNIALLAKWAWRFRVEEGAIWGDVIKAIHSGRGLWSFLPLKRSLPGCWKVIVNMLEATKVRDNRFHELIRGKLGCGDNIRFWLDLWWGDTLLKDRWPRLFMLDKNKKCWVGERLRFSAGVVQFNPNWRRGPATVEELSEHQDLDRLLDGVAVSDQRDRWVWNAQENESFSVQSVRNLLHKDDRSQAAIDSCKRFKWEGWVPLKVNLLTWRVARDRIPTRVALVRRGINLQDLSCPLCGCHDEDANHLFVRCEVAFQVWSSICIWCKLSPFFAYDFEDLMLLYKNVHAGKWRKKIIRGIIMVTTWVLWNGRNTKVFQNKDMKILEAVAEVKSKAFLWLKFRSKCNNIVWNDWVKYPLYSFV